MSWLKWFWRLWALWKERPRAKLPIQKDEGQDSNFAGTGMSQKELEDLEDAGRDKI